MTAVTVTVRWGTSCRAGIHVNKREHLVNTIKSSDHLTHTTGGSVHGHRNSFVSFWRPGHLGWVTGSTATWSGRVSGQYVWPCSSSGSHVTYQCLVCVLNCFFVLKCSIIMTDWTCFKCILEKPSIFSFVYGEFDSRLVLFICNN